MGGRRKSKRGGRGRANRGDERGGRPGCRLSDVSSGLMSGERRRVGKGSNRPSQGGQQFKAIILRPPDQPGAENNEKQGFAKLFS